MIRVGLVGAGPWASLFTAPMLASAPGMALAAVWARRPAAAGALAHQHGAAAVDSFDDLLAACDAVAFTVPADVQELRAAEAGGVVTVSTVHDSGASGHVAISGTTPGAAGRLDAEAVTDTGHVVLADPTPHQLQDVQRAIADEFARAVRREFRQPLDVHHGVRLQRLIAAVAESLDTGGGVSVSGPGLGGRSDDEGG